MMMRAKSTVGLAVLMGAVQLAAAASPLRPGLWEVVVQADLGGVASAPAPSRKCLSQKDIDDRSKTLPKPSADRAIVTPKTVGDKTSYDLVCQGTAPMRGHADIRSAPNSYDGTVLMSMKTGPNQPERPVKFSFAGRRVGDCGSAK